MVVLGCLQASYNVFIIYSNSYIKNSRIVGIHAHVSNDSPVSAHTIFGSLAATASEPMDATDSESKMGSQWSMAAHRTELNQRSQPGLFRMPRESSESPSAFA